jgi:uncharacterized protein YfaQ (DUF2300 family)
MSELIINGNYHLSPDIQLSEVNNVPGVSQSITQTMGGVVEQGRAKAVGQRYQLSADSRSQGLYGFFTRTDHAYLAELRDSRAVFSVAHPSRTLAAVLIPADGIALEVVQGDETVEQEDGEKMFGTITLIKVG